MGVRSAKPAVPSPEYSPEATCQFFSVSILSFSIRVFYSEILQNSAFSFDSSNSHAQLPYTPRGTLHTPASRRYACRQQHLRAYAAQVCHLLQSKRRLRFHLRWGGVYDDSERDDSEKRRKCAPCSEYPSHPEGFPALSLNGLCPHSHTCGGEPFAEVCLSEIAPDIFAIRCRGVQLVRSERKTNGAIPQDLSSDDLILPSLGRHSLFQNSYYRRPPNSQPAVSGSLQPPCCVVSRPVSRCQSVQLRL